MNKFANIFLIALSIFNLHTSMVFADVHDNKDISYWTKLRMDFAASKNFLPQWDTDSDRRAIIVAHKEKKYDEAVRWGEDWLKKCPVDLDVHLILADSYAGLNDNQRSNEHMQSYQGLLGSIAASGSGRSENTPYSVISTAEAHAVIRSLNASAKYTLLPSGVEMAEFKDAEGKPFMLYFKYAKEYWDSLPA